MVFLKAVITAIMLGGYSVVQRTVMASISRDLAVTQMRDSDTASWSYQWWHQVGLWGWLVLAAFLIILWWNEIGSIVKWFQKDSQIKLGK